MRRFLEILSENPDITDDELRRLLAVKRTRFYTLTRQMAEAGLIQIAGRGERKKYIPNNTEKHNALSSEGI
jgi:predicted transcriptional regulator